MNIKWPKGCAPFYKFVDDHQETILSGCLVAVDPSSGRSSPPGFAIFAGGELQTKGTIRIDSRLDLYQRLQVINDKVAAITPVVPDVLVVEEIQKRTAHVSLLFAVGATFGASRSPRAIQVPVCVWKAVAQTVPHYEKDDAADAEMMGLSAILRAKWLQKEG
jgi:hypothetical protein